MAFSSKQVRQLRARLRPNHVRERQADGKILHYIEGWHAVAEANRIFGFDGWDRETLSSQCVWQKNVEGRCGASYVTRVRLTIHAGEQTVVREGIGSGESFAPTPGQAHERAAKAAETDATKRALSTFGNRFGLSLYGDKQQELLRGRAPSQPSPAASDVSPSPRHDTPEPNREFSGPSPHSRVDSAQSLDPQTERPRPQPAFRVSAPLKAGGTGTAVETLPPGAAANDGPHGGRSMLLPVIGHVLPPVRTPVDKSVLPIGEPKRLRCPEHLRFVARQACLVCGRVPTQAHHLRFAQPRALSRKVSDEFTVPLCAFHHDEVHRTGNEFQWWRARGIDALQLARDLWRETRDFPGSTVRGVDAHGVDGTDVEETPAPAEMPP
jgi:DNA recombination protein Rad52